MVSIQRRQTGTPTSSSSRASSSSGSTGTTSATTSSTTSNKSSYEPTPTPTPMPQRVDNQATKTILEWVFLAFALLLLAVLVIRRIDKLRNEDVPLSQFFRRHRRRRSQSLLSNPDQQQTTEIRRLPRTTGLPTLPPSSASAPFHLAEIPVAHLTGDRQGSAERYVHQINHLLYGHGRRFARTRGVDIDEGGRRGVGVRDVERDYLGDDGDDGLPAYDKHGGPPVYVEVVGVRAARGRTSTSTTTRDAGVSAADGNRDTAQSQSASRTEASSPQPSIQNPFSEQRTRPPRYSSSLSMMPSSLSNW